MHNLPFYVKISIKRDVSSLDLVFQEEIVASYFAEQRVALRKKIDELVVGKTDELFAAPAKFGLQDRPGQTELALDIAEALRDGNNCMVEGGVGIGKTLGYLIPGLLMATTFRGPIVVATSSIALSEQLVQDATQAKVITCTTDFPVVLAKGMTNFVCPKRIFEAGERIREAKATGKPIDNNLLTMPKWVWGHAHQYPDRASLPYQLTDRQWKYVNANGCQMFNCNFKGGCGLYEMRQRIGNDGDAKVIITNQDQYIKNCLNIRTTGRGFINEACGLVIIDEAHNLEDKTRSALTERWGKSALKEAFGAVTPLLGRIDGADRYLKYLDRCHEYVEQYFSVLHNSILKEIAKNDRKRDALRFKVPAIRGNGLVSWGKMAYAFQTVLTMQTSYPRRTSAKNDQIIDQIGRVASFLTRLAGREAEKSNYLFWTEGNYENRNSLEVCCAPKHINEELRYLLFGAGAPPVILTSATLCEPGPTPEAMYAYQKRSLGFHGELLTPKDSPFNYNKNARVYIAADLEDPNRDRDLYLEQVALRIIELGEITGGRTLVLFTAKDDLKTVRDILDRKCLPWEVITQRDGGQQDATKKEFTAKKGILLSTGLWEGFNIPGPDLSQVIITRLPFPVPDPIIEYKTSLVRDPFTILVPEMLVKLRQGAGRLIRDEKDTGILSILDSRAGSRLNKSYRSTILDALPIKNVTELMVDLKLFADAMIPKK